MDRFKTCIQEAFKDYLAIIQFAMSLGRPVDYKIRTRAGIIHEQIKARLLDEFKNDSTIEMNEWKGIFALKFDNEIFVRVKKFTKGGNISNFPTTQHKQFLKQFLIEGFPDQPTFIFSGYEPNKSWTDITGVYLACWSADGLEWLCKIGESSIEQMPIEFPIPKTATGEKRVRVSRKSKPDTKTGTDNI